MVTKGDTRSLDPKPYALTKDILYCLDKSACRNDIHFIGMGSLCCASGRTPGR